MAPPREHTRRDPARDPAEREPAAAHRDPEPDIARVQRAVGNQGMQRAAERARVVRRPDAVDVAALLAAKVPDLLPEIPADQIDALQTRANVRARNAELGRQLAKLESEPVSYESYDQFIHGRRQERIWSKLQPEPQGPDEILVPTMAVLDPDILAADPEASDAESELRTTIVSDMLRSPFIAVKVYDRAGSAMEGSGIVHDVGLFWNGKALHHTNGKVTFADLTQKPGSLFARAYAERVTSQVTELRNALIELDSLINDARLEHEDLLERREKHTGAWAWSEIFGGQAWRHDPDLEIWNDPKGKIANAQQLLSKGQFKLAGLAYLRAQYATNEALSQYQDYAERVMGGAQFAVKWLGRAKLAGKFASTFVGGPLGRVGQALFVGGYSFSQEAIEQKLEKGSVDVGAVTKEAAVDALMTYLGGRTEEAFAETLGVHLKHRLLLANFSPAVTKRIISAAAASTASFYAVPADIVVRSIVTGKSRMPQSVDDLADMITEQAATGLLVSSFLGVTPHGVEPEVPTRGGGGAPELPEGQVRGRGSTAAGIGGDRPPGPPPRVAPAAAVPGSPRALHEAWAGRLAETGLSPRSGPGKPAGPPVSKGDYVTVSGEHTFSGPEKAFAAYHEALARVGSKEVGIFWNVESPTPQYRVGVGDEHGVSPPGDEWVTVMHSHPNPDNVLTLRGPAPKDVWETWRTTLRLNHPVTEFIDYPLPNGRRGLVAYTAEPDGRITIKFDKADGSRITREFKDPDDYKRHWGERTTYIDPGSPEYKWRMRDVADDYATRRPGTGHREAMESYLARRELKPFFEAAGLDAMSPEHDISSWDLKTWRDFFKANPNASKKQILDQLEKLKRR